MLTIDLESGDPLFLEFGGAILEEGSTGGLVVNPLRLESGSSFLLESGNMLLEEGSANNAIGNSLCLESGSFLLLQSNNAILLEGSWLTIESGFYLLTESLLRFVV